MEDILAEVIKIAERAGKEVLKVYARNYTFYEKQDKSPVSKADLISDKIISEELQKYGWPILSEESEDSLSRLGKHRVWIVDSLDGTMDFLEKTGEFSIMIGLIENQEPFLGVVYQPTEEKLYYAKKGSGSYLRIGNNEAKKLQVSGISNLPKVRLVVSRSHLSPLDIKLAKEMNIKKIEKFGSNGIKMGLIAEGKADLFFNTTDKMGEWDALAPELILKEAGGEVTDILGEKLVYNKKEPKNKKGIVASNRLIHQKAIEILKKI